MRVYISRFTSFIFILDFGFFFFRGEVVYSIYLRIGSRIVCVIATYITKSCEENGDKKRAIWTHFSDCKRAYIRRANLRCVLQAAKVNAFKVLHNTFQSPQKPFAALLINAFPLTLSLRAYRSTSKAIVIPTTDRDSMICSRKQIPFFFLVWASLSLRFSLQWLPNSFLLQVKGSEPTAAV